MTSARHLIEVLSQFGGSNQSCDGSDFFPADEGFYTRRVFEQRQQVLATTIETEIIPRLMLAHRETPDQVKTRRKKRRTFEHSDVVEFARLVVVHDVVVASAYVDAMLKQGATLEAVFTPSTR